MKGVSTAKAFKCQAYVQKFLIFFRRDLWIKVKFRRTACISSFVLARALTANPAVDTLAVPGLPPHFAHLSCIRCTCPPRRFPAILPKMPIPAHLRHPPSHHSSRIYRTRSNTPRPPAPPQSRLSTHLPHSLSSRRPASPSPTAIPPLAPPRQPLPCPAHTPCCRIRSSGLAFCSFQPSTSQPAPPPRHIASLPRPGV